MLMGGFMDRMKMIINKNNFSILLYNDNYYCFSYEKLIAIYNNILKITSQKLSGDNKKHLREFKKIVDRIKKM